MADRVQGIGAWQQGGGEKGSFRYQGLQGKVQKTRGINGPGPVLQFHKEYQRNKGGVPPLLFVSPFTPLKQRISEILNYPSMDDALPPLLRDTLQSVKGTGQLAIDSPGGVGIVSEVDGKQAPLAKRR